MGASWTEIWHETKYLPSGPPTGITVLATGKTLLALGVMQSRSTDGGQTWTRFTKLKDDCEFSRERTASQL